MGSQTSTTKTPPKRSWGSGLSNWRNCPSSSVTEIETVKAFLSRQTDHYRPSYGRRAVSFPHQQVFVATTNAEHYFKDRTGNRRYWPLTVKSAL